MSAVTVLRCDRCNNTQEFPMRSRFSAPYMDNQGNSIMTFHAWRDIDEILLCPGCVKDIQAFMKKKLGTE